MFGAAGFILLAALVQVPEGPNNAAGLVARLGGDDHAAAERTLERLGPRALPALRPVAEGVDGSSTLRERAAALVDKIESGLLTGPTLVTLDYRDQPLDEVLASLARRSGMRLIFNDGNEERRRAVRVTLEEPQPVPFWQAIDRLSRQARSQYNFATSERSGVSETVLRFSFPGDPPEDRPSYVGAFRISISQLRYHDESRLVRGDDGKVHRSGRPKLDLSVYIRGEPRLRIGQDDLPRRVEILDTEDRPVTHELFPGEDRPLNWAFTQLVMVPEQSINFWNYQMAAPATGDLRLKSLKATVKLAIEGRRPDPLVIPLADSRRRTFRQGSLDLEVTDVRDEPGRRPEIELAARFGDFRAARTLQAPYNDWIYWAGGVVEVRDAQGEPMTWKAGPLAANPADDRARLRIVPDADTHPAEIRYYGLMRTIAEVPIELSDIPIPGRP